MLTPLLSRFLLLLLTVLTLGCSKKDDEPSPKDIIGHWKVKFDKTETYSADGARIDTKTNTSNIDGRYFREDTGFEFSSGFDVDYWGTYTFTNKSLLVTPTPGTPGTDDTPISYTVTKFTGKELVIVLDKREPGKVGTVYTEILIKK